jgi:F420-dependent oxidoreductase-like protein
MQLGLHLAFSGAQLRIPVDLVQRAEALGYSTVWTAESYGSDALTPLAYLAPQTKRIRLATGIAHFAARTPASAAMSFGSLEQLAGQGRVVAGFGMSGPQIVEGWYGVPWGRPYHTVKDYVAIVRKVFRREEPVAHAGRGISLPVKGDNALGIGKPVKSILHMNPATPIMLGTSTEAMVRLTAEIADGWLTPLHFIPSSMRLYRPHLDAGFARRDPSLGNTFEIHACVPTVLTSDVSAALERMRQAVAFYAGRMGSNKINFYNGMMARQGYPEAAARVLELSQAGHFDEALQAVPLEYCDDLALIGPPKRLAERYRAWADCGVTGLALLTTERAALEAMAEIAGTDSRDGG